ncbi:MAG: DUF1440 domain-containing protein [Acidobacteriota bacterium]|nr:DUF1440 domain-containing protein [Acidobacteriota bacterium]
MWNRNVSGADVAKGALAGLAGGLVASWTMEKFQAALSKTVQKQKQGGGEPATVKVAQGVSQKLRSRDLAPEEKQPAGEMVHYAFGGGAGAVYGLTAETVPKAKAGWGTLFGAVLWVLADEVGVPAAGLGEWPAHSPAGEQAAALAAHLVYGATVETVRRGVRGLLG